MSRTAWACLALLGFAPFVGALVVAPAPVGTRAVQADAVIVGKVVSIEEKTIKAPRFIGDREEGEFHIAVVKVEESLIGATGVKEIKVGFVKPPMVKPVKPGDPMLPIRPIRPIRFASPQLQKDQEAVLFLQKHLSGSFHVAPNYFDVIDSKSPEYKTSIEQLRTVGKVLKDPTASLKSKDNKERFQAASVMLSLYRSRRPGPAREEVVPAEQSKLILQALADADWDARPTGRFEATPMSAFYMLNLKPQDGWVQPRDFREVPAAAREWLRGNAATFKLTRFVSEAPAEK